MAKKQPLPQDVEYELEIEKPDGTEIEVEGDREDAHYKTIRTGFICTCICSVAGFSAAWLVSRVGAFHSPTAMTCGFGAAGVFMLGYTLTVSLLRK